MTTPVILTPRQFRVLLISISVAAIGYISFAVWSGWDEVIGALKKVSLDGVLLILLMSLVNYGLRFIRWQGYLAALGHHIGHSRSLSIYLAGFALTTTPGKAGEALRGVLLKPLGVPYSHSFAAFFSERLSDLLAIILLTLAGLSLQPNLQILVWVSVLAVVTAFLLLNQKHFSKQLLSYAEKKPTRIYQFIAQLCQILLDAQRCHKPKQLLSASILSLIAWGAEALAFYWVLSWMGAEVSLQFAVFVYAISMLAGAVSFMPGGLGGAEAVMVALLILAGMSGPDAVAATVLIRLATLWFAVAIGAISLARTQ